MASAHCSPPIARQKNKNTNEPLIVASVAGAFYPCGVVVARHGVIAAARQD
ncbi:hypothetical protein COCCADRAFT_91756 [Bipolaris zeicola 26-R-13]|uniref:Uncharacterized protein n=1 Tax=Cochliobolus carbonum (strain 26-R-13) TaxID=930089 RepID=W6Y6B0_COCC2|nr:uncharacterized protein COCCADRAFT_91756 [Bipolaris zeicola 26-R-13]EUC35087.1 hypothetical protein COCCADRAFT_91756 [Bipolaris zeicola 26-R-13]